VEQGVVSRNGFTVLYDSDTLVLEEDGWVAVRQENGVDAYFFGYGFDYVAAVQDFYSLTGVPPMLPAYALGNWWSRYHAYTQEEYLDLIHRFREEDIPFSVGVVDMDWHLVDVDVPSPLKNDLNGWTGYTWNEKLFPDFSPEQIKDLENRLK
jgi:alpha-glucosidase (family GH31 glycosyl hydrolase)